MDITDCVRDLETGDKLRITGFYHVQTRPQGHRVLLPAFPEDPRCSVIGTYAACGKFHRPWTLAYEGPIPWSKDLIEAERSAWAGIVAKADLSISSAGYPELFRHLPPLSGHERVLLAKWRRDHFDMAA